MYYITNQTNQIIAADNNLLELLQIKSIDALTKHLILGDINFNLSDNENLQIVAQGNTLEYATKTSVLSSLLGDLQLVQLESRDTDAISSIEVNSAISDMILEEDVQSDDEHLDIMDTPTPKDEPVLSIDESTTHKEDETSTISLLDDSKDDIYNLTIPKSPDTTIDEITVDTQEPTNLSLDTIEEDNDTQPEIVNQESIEIEDKSIADTTPIIIDIDKVSESIGISSDDYNTFLNEYIDTAISLETDLQTTDESIQSAAKETLTQLADVLELPLVNDIILQLNTIDTSKNKNTIESFYTVLSRLTTEKQEITTEDNIVEDNIIVKDDNIILVEESNLHSDAISEETNKETINFSSESSSNEITSKEEPTIEKDSIDFSSKEPTKPTSKEEPTVEKDSIDFNLTEDTPSIEKEEILDTTAVKKDSIDFDTELNLEQDDTTNEPITNKGFGTINLDTVKPIHFSFKLEEAANDLSLPVELIEEFVNDFIEQAHIETKKMLAAYEEGDLDTIQKIGHLLKGTSSNLRINPLADTLYKIQFCEDSNLLENYITEYWGHFLSFEQQLNALSK